MDTAEAVLQRKSVRAFLDKPVPEQTLRGIFERAQRAPSWCNIQPWRVFIASGKRRDQYIAELTTAAMSRGPETDVPFPAEYPEPYGTHRRACGKALYEAMGVERNDGPARQAAWMRNFAAFDAPHVALVALDKRFGPYGTLDIGCWLSTVLLLATAEGVATCAQASLGVFPDIARKYFDIPAELNLLFGIGLGYEDTAAAANRCHTTRDPLEQNVRFLPDEIAD
jgi:nitroreductase